MLVGVRCAVLVNWRFPEGEYLEKRKYKIYKKVAKASILVSCIYFTSSAID
ncbi:hypothetical protein T4B_337 [Trichinella pseudospiralis]|uniref:Uncharacterized protein n=1 Tax=Trichinella pseudospiralis TaxID=6337 RepID=A0A0V1GKU3_TRIPS|nr:hypothetical protein T4B_337 [Trichinella pseudospiralis]